MCGPSANRFEPSFDSLARDLFMGATLRSPGFDRNQDKEYIHSIEWAYSMLRNGGKVRRKSWPSNHYAFLYRKNGSLYGNSLIIDQADLSKIILDRFATMIMRADSEDETCMPLEETVDINLNDWAAA